MGNWLLISCLVSQDFLKEIQARKETMRDLDRAGTQLKYFSQKQDVILIKNLLISVQNRWEKVQSRCNDRTRQLDSGYKRAKQVLLLIVQCIINLSIQIILCAMC